MEISHELEGREYKALDHREINNLSPIVHSIYALHNRLTSPNNDTSSRVTLWYALPFRPMIRHSSCDIGDIVWAHKETQELFQGLAEVVVGALLPPA